jgi:hypothetical protein
MRRIDGIARLIAELQTPEANGWIFTAERSDRETIEKIVAATFFLAEDDEEEIDMEDDFPTFLEIRIFESVIELEARAGRTTPHDIAAGCLHYLVMDTFRD